MASQVSVKGSKPATEVQLDYVDSPETGVDWVVETVAGCKKPGSSDGPRLQALVHSPCALAASDDGRIFAIEKNGTKVRVITPDGDVISTKDAALLHPLGIVASKEGLFIADTGHHRIRFLSFASDLKECTTIAGTGKRGCVDGVALKGSLFKPQGICLTSNGVIVIADTGNHVIRAIQGGKIITVAGTGQQGFADGASLDEAEFSSPCGVCFDGDRGVIVVADTGNNSLRLISPDWTTVMTLTGGPGPGLRDGPCRRALFRSPRQIDVHGGFLFVADSENHCIRRVNLTSEEVQTLSGTGKWGTSEGLARESRFNSPLGVAATADTGGAAVLIADTGNHLIRQVVSAQTHTAPIGRRQSISASSALPNNRRMSAVSAMRMTRRVSTIQYQEEDRHDFDNSHSDDLLGDSDDGSKSSSDESQLAPLMPAATFKRARSMSMLPKGRPAGTASTADNMSRAASERAASLPATSPRGSSAAKSLSSPGSHGIRPSFPRDVGSPLARATISSPSRQSSMQDFGALGEGAAGIGPSENIESVGPHGSSETKTANQSQSPGAVMSASAVRRASLSARNKFKADGTEQPDDVWAGVPRQQELEDMRATTTGPASTVASKMSRPLFSGAMQLFTRGSGESAQEGQGSWSYVTAISVSLVLNLKKAVARLRITDSRTKKALAIKELPSDVRIIRAHSPFFVGVSWPRHTYGFRFTAANDCRRLAEALESVLNPKKFSSLLADNSVVEDNTVATVTEFQAPIDANGGQQVEAKVEDGLGHTDALKASSPHTPRQESLPRSRPKTQSGSMKPIQAWSGRVYKPSSQPDGKQSSSNSSWDAPSELSHMAEELQRMIEGEAAGQQVVSVRAGRLFSWLKTATLCAQDFQETVAELSKLKQGFKEPTKADLEREAGIERRKQVAMAVLPKMQTAAIQSVQEVSSAWLTQATESQPLDVSAFDDAGEVLGQVDEDKAVSAKTRTVVVDGMPFRVGTRPLDGMFYMQSLADPDMIFVDRRIEFLFSDPVMCDVNTDEAARALQQEVSPCYKLEDQLTSRLQVALQESMRDAGANDLTKTVSESVANMMQGQDSTALAQSSSTQRRSRPSLTVDQAIDALKYKSTTLRQDSASGLTKNQAESVAQETSALSPVASPAILSTPAQIGNDQIENSALSVSALSLATNQDGPDVYAWRPPRQAKRLIDLDVLECGEFKDSTAYHSKICSLLAPHALLVEWQICSTQGFDATKDGQGNFNVIADSPIWITLKLFGLHASSLSFKVGKIACDLPKLSPAPESTIQSTQCMIKAVLPPMPPSFPNASKEAHASSMKLHLPMLIDAQALGASVKLEGESLNLKLRCWESLEQLTRWNELSNPEGEFGGYEYLPTPLQPLGKLSSRCWARAVVQDSLND